MRVETREDPRASGVEAQKEHPEHARKEHQQQAPDHIRDREDDVPAQKIEVVAARDAVDRGGEDRRQPGAGGLRRRRRTDAGERHQQGVERDRREQHDRGPAQHDAVVAAHEGNQGKTEHGGRSRGCRRTR